MNRAGLSNGAGQFFGALGPKSPSFNARLVIPSVNSVGNVARDFVGRSERPQPLVGEADIETDGRLLVAPWRLAGDPGNVRVSARNRYAEEFSRRCAVPDLEDEMAHDAPGDSRAGCCPESAVRLNLSLTSQLQTCWRTCAAEKPG